MSSTEEHSKIFPWGIFVAALFSAGIVAIAIYIGVVRQYLTDPIRKAKLYVLELWSRPDFMGQYTALVDKTGNFDAKELKVGEIGSLKLRTVNKKRIDVFIQDNEGPSLSISSSGSPVKMKTLPQGVFKPETLNIEHRVS